MIYPEIEDIERTVEVLISMRDYFTEDIPAFNTRYEGKLESILATIQANYFGEEMYSGVLEKAVMLFYLIIKNHPFFNGNKRTAILVLYEFLSNNVKELYIDISSIVYDEGLYKMATYTAESDQSEFEVVKEYLRLEIDSFILEY